MVTYDFGGRRTLVTGAGSGIGRACAVAFARAGARVLVVDVNIQGGQETVNQCAAAGGDAAFIRADVSDEHDVGALFNQIMTGFGRLDIAINNAGVQGAQLKTADERIDNWDRTLGINLRGVFLCMRREIQLMLPQGKGVIVNVSSTAALEGYASSPAYVASKHGVLGLTRTAALEYVNGGVRINTICPGMIRTPMFDTYIDSMGEAVTMEQIANGVPAKRLGRPEEISQAVLWLSSDDASFVVGQAIVIDGGLTAGKGV